VQPRGAGPDPGVGERCADRPNVRHYFEGVLQRLGYHARVKAVPEAELRYGDSRARTQLGPTGWSADRLSASNFFRPLLTCGAFTPNGAANGNLFEYCNPRLDTKIEEATAAQSTDPARAARLWTQIDRMVVDQAVAVPWANPRNTALVSKRDGNYQSHPLLGTLLDQLWVK
jgi:peptide/nickel transport system substrate-binding protein